jgi:hypothetical protein
MKAIVQDTCGSPDVLELPDIGKPAIARRQGAGFVHAAGVDRGWQQMSGLPYPIWLAGHGLWTPKTHRSRLILRCRSAPIESEEAP